MLRVAILTLCKRYGDVDDYFAVEIAEALGDLVRRRPGSPPACQGAKRRERQQAIYHGFGSVTSLTISSSQSLNTVTRIW
jgi:hypothetical protein